MKKLIASALCLFMLVGIGGQSVRAEEDPSGIVGGVANDSEVLEQENRKEIIPTEDNSNKMIATVVTNHNETILPNEKGVYNLNKLDKVKLEFPNGIGKDKYTLDTHYTNPEMFKGKAHFSRGNDGSIQVQNVEYIDFYYLIKNDGESKISFVLTNTTDESDTYQADITINLNSGKLMVSKSEYNLKMDELVYVDNNDSELPSPNLVDVIKAGFLLDNGSIEFDPNRIEITNSDPNVAGFGIAMPKDHELIIEKLFHDASTKVKYLKYLEIRLQSIKGSFIAFTEWAQILEDFMNLNGLEGNGIGVGGVRTAIMPRKAGTTYITLSFGNQSTTIKVNVSNTSEAPTDKIPSDITGEFNNDNNSSVNVSLSAPDTVKPDVFKSAKETGKPVSFDIKGTDNKTQYAWTFNGKDITNPDMSLDLGIKYTSNRESNIRKLVNQENMMFLSFNHHGALPGKASMKINVSEKYKDGEYVFLNYFNEEKGIIESQGDKFLVKNGYVEFTIDHCSEYFLTTQLVSNSTIVEDTKPVEDDVIKNTGSVETGDTTMPIVLLSLLIVSGGMLIVLNKKRAFNKK